METLDAIEAKKLADAAMGSEPGRAADARRVIARSLAQAAAGALQLGTGAREILEKVMPPS